MSAYINAFDELCFWGDCYSNDSSSPNSEQRVLVDSMGWADDLIFTAADTPVTGELRDELIKEINGGIDTPANLWDAIVYNCNDSSQVVAKFYPQYAPIIEQMNNVFDLV